MGVCFGGVVDGVVSWRYVIYRLYLLHSIFLMLMLLIIVCFFYTFFILYNVGEIIDY